MRYRIEIAKGILFALLTLATSVLLAAIHDTSKIYIPVVFAFMALWCWYKADRLARDR